MRKREKQALELYLYGAIITKDGFVMRDFVMPHPRSVKLQTHSLPLEFKVNSDAYDFQKFMLKPSCEHLFSTYVTLPAGSTFSGGDVYFDMGSVPSNSNHNSIRGEQQFPDRKSVV